MILFQAPRRGTLRYGLWEWVRLLPRSPLVEVQVYRLCRGYRRGQEKRQPVPAAFTHREHVTSSRITPKLDFDLQRKSILGLIFCFVQIQFHIPLNNTIWWWYVFRPTVGKLDLMFQIRSYISSLIRALSGYSHYSRCSILHPIVLTSHEEFTAPHIECFISSRDNL